MKQDHAGAASGSPKAPQYPGSERELGAAMSCAWSAALFEPSNLSPDSREFPKVA